jgi:hypothetical protein
MNLPTRIMSWPLWLYAGCWVFFMYLYIQLLDFSHTVSSNLLLNGMQFIDFGVHEASHLIVFFLPAVFVALAGSAGEIIFPCLLLYAVLKAKAYFVASFIGLWLMLALNSVGRYIADARSQQLPLLGPGETVKHDWNFILDQFGWLQADTAIGTTVIVIGNLIGGAALLSGLGLMIYKIKAASR